MTDLLTCRTCGAQKAPDGFHRRKRSATGRDSQCTKCANTAAANRRLAKRAGDFPVSFEWVALLAKRLPEQDQRHLWEILRSAAKRAQLFPDAFDRNFR